MQGACAHGGGGVGVGAAELQGACAYFGQVGAGDGACPRHAAVRGGVEGAAAHQGQATVGAGGRGEHGVEIQGGVVHHQLCGLRAGGGCAQVVIAADGVNSKVRKLIFGEFTSNYVGLSVWRYAFKRPASLDTGYIFFNKKHKLGVIPMTAETCYIFVNSAEGDNPIIPEDQLVDKLKAYMSAYPIPMVQELIPQVTDAKLVNYRTLETLKMPAPWYKNRVVVLGDAAHTTIPQLGSGAALAIEDAVVLIEELQKEGSIEEVFERYMKRRYDRCKMVVDVSETLGAWELLEYTDQPLPEGANMGMLMGKTGMVLAEEI